jgi:Transglycosylase SLT domain
MRRRPAWPSPGRLAAGRVGSAGGWLGLTAVLGLAIAGSAAASAGSLVAGNAAALDRVAFAVDGVESSHGADVKMWRPNLDGPQGPMQVSAAAAIDVGDGDRFDLSENRILGRAYLARLYRRYANWVDAVAAYNWGPGHMDAWIDSGRPIDKFPETVALYRVRVLFGGTPGGGGFATLGHHIQPRRPLADRLRPSRSSIAVEQLYNAVMRDSWWR